MTSLKDVPEKLREPRQLSKWSLTEIPYSEFHPILTFDSRDPLGHKITHAEVTLGVLLTSVTFMFLT